MKLFKKKTTVTLNKAKVTPLDKTQLNQIIGGTEGTPIGGTMANGHEHDKPKG